jgi:hypothetical protein
MGSRVALDVIEIKHPCTQSWEEMTGDGRVRFCDHCQKNVHNLSAMPMDEAEKLLCESAGQLCVRFERAPEGKMLTLDYQPAPAGKRRAWALWTLVGGSAAAAVAVVNLVLMRPKVSIVMGNMPIRPMVMGRPVWVPPATQPSTAPNVPAPTTRPSSEDAPQQPVNDVTR